MKINLTYTKVYCQKYNEIDQLDWNIKISPTQPVVNCL